MLRIIGFCLLAGFLSFGVAEVAAGSSPNWLLSPWSWLVTYPLYLVHFLFFMAISLRFNRTGIKSLYLLGVLFGLYETWLTKVVWAGYEKGGHPFGDIAGFGVHETFGLVMFYHPVAAFILPVAMLGRMSPAFAARFSELNWLFSSSRSSRKALVFLGFIFVAISSANLGSLPTILLTWGPTLIFGYFGYWVLKSSLRETGERYLKFLAARFVLPVLCLLMIGMYIAGYFLLLPERIATWPVQAATVACYLAIIGVLTHQKPGVAVAIVAAEISNSATMWRWICSVAAGVFMLSFLPFLIPPLFLAALIMTLPTGLGLFVWAVLPPRRRKVVGG